LINRLELPNEAIPDVPRTPFFFSVTLVFFSQGSFFPPKLWRASLLLIDPQPSHNFRDPPHFRLWGWVSSSFIVLPLPPFTVLLETRQTFFRDGARGLFFSLRGFPFVGRLGAIDSLGVQNVSSTLSFFLQPLFPLLLFLGPCCGVPKPASSFILSPSPGSVLR